MLTNDQQFGVFDDLTRTFSGLSFHFLLSFQSSVLIYHLPYSNFHLNNNPPTDPPYYSHYKTWNLYEVNFFATG